MTAKMSRFAQGYQQALDDIQDKMDAAIGGAEGEADAARQWLRANRTGEHRPRPTVPEWVRRGCSPACTLIRHTPECPNYR